MAYPMTPIQKNEYVMRFIPPPPPPPPAMDISVTFNPKFQMCDLEKDVISNALERLITETKFLERFPEKIVSLNIQVITCLHKDKVNDKCDHINCRFLWRKENGETNKFQKGDGNEISTSHVYFNESHSRIWQVSEMKYEKY
jgi:hypothetical protein